MSTPFDTLTALRDEWQALQPLAAENEARLWKKLRLEWNYHSNHIEGNTLTYGETALLLLHDRTTGNHSHREYLEMKAHDVAIEHVRAFAADLERPLTEGDIRDLNKIILKEPFWKPAETPDGQPTRKEIIPGQYKTTPNNVRLPNGDLFFFASVEDTPPRMASLASWLQQELKSPTLHPVAFAVKLHHDFVCIHPFDDGNGRVARLLVNYVLMRGGYLPLVVRTEDKTNYLTALQLADAGEFSALTSYFHQLTEWSLKLGIKAAQGETIDEPGDVEKEVNLFVRAQQAGTPGAPPRTPSLVRQITAQGIKPFFQTLTQKMAALSPLFGETGKPGPAQVLSELALIDPFNAKPPSYTLEKRFDFFGFTGKTDVPFDFSTVVTVDFEPADYRVSCDGLIVKSFRYDELLTTEHAEKLAASILKTSFEKIKNRSGGVP